MGGMDLCKLQFCLRRVTQLLPLVWSKNTCQATALDYCIWKKISIQYAGYPQFCSRMFIQWKHSSCRKMKPGWRGKWAKIYYKESNCRNSDINVMWVSAWEEPWTAAVLQENSLGSSATPLTVMCVLQALLFGPLALCIHNQQCHVKLLHLKRNCLKISCKQQLIM